VDLSSGRQLWQVDLADHSKVPARLTNPQISVSGDIVAVRTTAVIQGYGLSDGKLRWATPKEPPFSATSCSLGNEAAGPKLVYAIYTCFSTAKQSLKLVGYDRTSGAQTWTGDVSQLPVNDQPAIVSADPLILTDTNAKQAYSFASGGTSPVKIDLHGLSYQVFETQNDGQALLRHAYAIVGNTLYAQGRRPAATVEHRRRHRPGERTAAVVQGSGPLRLRHHHRCRRRRHPRDNRG